MCNRRHTPKKYLFHSLSDQIVSHTYYTVEVNQETNKPYANLN